MLSFLCAPVCPGPNPGLIFLTLFLSFALVLFLFVSAQGSAGHMSILLYFVQTALLQCGPISAWLNWLSFVNFNVYASSHSQCMAQLTPYEQVLFSIFTPMLLLAELGIIMTIHAMMYKCITTDSDALNQTQQQQSDDSAASFSLSRAIVNFAASFNTNRYVGASLAILLFCYTQVALSCLSYLVCVDVGSNHSLVYANPVMNCNSSAYASTSIGVIFMLIVFVIGFPLAVAAGLWRAHRAATMAAAINAASPSFSSSVAVHTSSQPAALVSVSPQSQQRWGILSASFHSRAWYWQALVLLRRTLFVAASVTLIEDSRSKLMCFCYFNSCAYLLHSYVQPYREQRLNQWEAASHTVLLFVSILLLASSEPYTQPVQIALTALIVPLTALFVAATLTHHYRGWMHRRTANMQRADGGGATAKDETMDVDEPSQTYKQRSGRVDGADDGPWQPSPLHGDSVELSVMHSQPPQQQLASPSGLDGTESMHL